MNRTMLFTVALALGLAASGCTAITDFEKPKDAGPDAGGLYSIDDNLAAAVVTVTLTGNAGALNLQLTTPLPAADDAILIGMLEDGTVGLNVRNETTGTNFDLTEGTYSETISMAGDYNMSLSTDRTSLTINFYNEIEEAVLHVDGDYLATITVLSNTIFVTETFTRDVSVTGG